MKKKKKSKWDRALQPVPSAWTFDTHMHSPTAPAYHSRPHFWVWICIDVQHAAENASHPVVIYPHHFSFVLLCKWIVQIQQQYQHKPALCWISAFLCILCCSTPVTEKSILHTFNTYFGLTIVVHTEKHFNRHSFLLHPHVCSAAASWMVNKRWICSRIKTLKWLPDGTQWSQTHWRPPFN